MYDKLFSSSPVPPMVKVWIVDLHVLGITGITITIAGLRHAVGELRVQCLSSSFGNGIVTRWACSKDGGKLHATEGLLSSLILRAQQFG